MDIEKRANEIKTMQISALQSLKIDINMIHAISKIASMRSVNGRIITTGMGKAGIIAQKMSATLASIGFPSFFVSPAEAAHGDMGRIASNDLIIVFSNSGSTGEVINLIENVHKLNGHQNFVLHIGGTETPQIPADLIINYGKLTESCIVSKVPATSTTMMLLIADILAITAAESCGLNNDWFKARHPGGAIGQSYRTSMKNDQK